MLGIFSQDPVAIIPIFHQIRDRSDERREDRSSGDHGFIQDPRKALMVRRENEEVGLPVHSFQEIPIGDNPVKADPSAKVLLRDDLFDLRRIRSVADHVEAEVDFPPVLQPVRLW